MKEKQPKLIPTKTNKLTRDNRGLSIMSILGESITTVSPDGERIPIKKKNKKLSEISITGNKITQDPDNQSKKAKVGISIDVTKIHVELAPPPNTNKQDYADGTNDKTRDSQTRETVDSQSETDSCAINIDEEHKNEEDEDYIYTPYIYKI